MKKLLPAIPWLIGIVVYFLADSYLSLGTSILIAILFALSLDISLGYGGIITLGHAAFFGFGGYVAGLCALHLFQDPLLGLVAAAVLTGLFGLLTGMLILHTQGLTLMMLTLAVASMLAEFANQSSSWTGGDDGLTGIKVSPLLGLFSFDMWGKTAYLYALAVLLVWSLLAWRIMGSPFGKSLDGIRQNPARMRAIGTPVWWRLVAAYTLSAAMAGTAGALSAQVTKTVSLNSLGILMSGTVLVTLILGGMRRKYGAFIGAIVYVVCQNFAAEIDPFRWMFVIGCLLIAVVLFMENGLIGLTDMAKAYISRLVGAKDRK
jgi:branched-chain amino acid transport system permease protein